MKKMILVVVSIMFMSVIFVGVASDYSDAEERRADSALSPNIYKIESSEGWVTTSNRDGWVKTYTFTKDSINEKNFIDAINKRQEPPNNTDSDISPNNRVTYVLSTSMDLKIYLGNIVMPLEDNIFRESETVYKDMKSGTNVKITVDEGSFAKFNGAGEDYLVLSDVPIKISVSGDYIVYTSDRKTFISYTIEYDDNIKNNNALAMVCVLLGAAGVILLIWFGRKQNMP